MVIFVKERPFHPDNKGYFYESWRACWPVCEKRKKKDSEEQDGDVSRCFWLRMKLKGGKARKEICCELSRGEAVQRPNYIFTIT